MSNFKHGHSGKKQSKVYTVWCNMLARCNNIENKSYWYYGGRGIEVCKNWLSFENFLKDMGEPELGQTLDRIDNNKGYYKENCRWISKVEQARNKTNNRNYTYKGITKCLKEWAREFNMEYLTLYSRVTRNKWSFVKAITTPVKDK